MVIKETLINQEEELLSELVSPIMENIWFCEVDIRREPLLWGPSFLFWSIKKDGSNMIEIGGSIYYIDFTFENIYHSYKIAETKRNHTKIHCYIRQWIGWNGEREAHANILIDLRDPNFYPHGVTNWICDTIKAETGFCPRKKHEHGC